MGRATMTAKLIKIEVRRGEQGLWHATSPDMPGLRVTDTSRTELFAEIPRVLEMLCEGMSAHQVEWKASDDLYWVIVPTRKSDASN